MARPRPLLDLLSLGGSNGVHPLLLPWEGTNADPYPFLEMASGADVRGMQVAKWTVRERTTPLINVGGGGAIRP
jgi:hypothetical protein